MMGADIYDLERLRLTPEQITQLTNKPAKPKSKIKKKGWQRQFVRVPWHWVDHLKAAKSLATYRLALELLYEGWRLGGRTLTLSNVAAATTGLDRRAKWRALCELENLGLIHVKRKRGHAPRITLWHLDSPGPAT